MYRKLLINGGLFAVILISILYLLNYIVDHGLKKERSSEFSVWNDIYSGKINADLIVMGGSRASAHVSPPILDSILGINTYNLGVFGWTFKMHDTRFKIYIQHNKLPHYIIYCLDIESLGSNKELYNFSQFIPYLKDPLIQKGTQGYEGSFSIADYYFPFVKYKSQYPLIKRGITDFIKPPLVFDQPRVKGFEGREDKWDGAFDRFKAEHADSLETICMDSSTVMEFNDFLAFCKGHNIKVIMAYTPEYYEAQKIFSNRDSMMSVYKSLAAKYDCGFLDYSSDTLGLNKKYFYNSQHMNKQGAEIFSRELANDVKKYIK